MEGSATIADGRDYVERYMSDGCDCPCCDQYCKLYRRELNSGMGYALCLIRRYFLENPTERWCHVEDYLKTLDFVPTSVRSRYYSLLRFWGLIEPKTGTKDDGNPRTGYWRITDRGVRFVEGKINVPRYVLIYNNQFRGFWKADEYRTTLRRALEKKFNYQDVMASAFDDIR